MNSGIGVMLLVTSDFFGAITQRKLAHFHRHLLAKQFVMSLHS